jgi:pimeloyl-ACP methyl ester carboxylesterase
LALFEGGDVGGVPVVVFHGTPGSGLLFPSHVQAALGRHVGLVSYDRPGYGSSTRQPGRAVFDAAADVGAVAAELGVESLGVLGISGGGPHALACAARLPGLVAAGAVLDCPAPLDAIPMESPMMLEEKATRFGFVPQPPFSPAFFDQARRWLLSASPNEVILELGPSADTRSGVDREVAGQWLAAARAGLVAGPEGWEDDAFALGKPWGVELSEIRCPIGIFHSGDDRVVPAGHARWLAEHIEGAKVVVDTAEGHLDLVGTRAGEVFDWLVGNCR